MSSDKEKKDRVLISIIITVSLAGILYFGWRVIFENSRKNQENPFAYNIDFYKKSGADFIHYSEVKQINIGLEKALGIAVGPEDKLYISGENMIRIFRPDGNVLSTWRIAGPAHCLVVDENQDIYLGLNEHIEIYDREGKKKAQWDSLGENAIITSIAVSEQYVFIADAGNLIVWRFDKQGNNRISIGKKNENKDIPGFLIPSAFFDVDIDPDGFLWAANTGRHSMENYTQDGDFRTSWGKFSMEIDGFCGCCNPSHFVIMEDGSFVTAEKGIARVKIYNILGNLVSVVAGPDRFTEGTKGLDLALDSSQRIYVLDPPKKAVRIFVRKAK